MENSLDCYGCELEQPEGPDHAIDCPKRRDGGPVPYHVLVLVTEGAPHHPEHGRTWSVIDVEELPAVGGALDVDGVACAVEDVRNPRQLVRVGEHGFVDFVLTVRRQPAGPNTGESAEAWRARGGVSAAPGDDLWSGEAGRFMPRAEWFARTRCADCGDETERTGHMGCQYPGRSGSQ